MGNCFSDPSSPHKGQGKGQVLGSGPATQPNHPPSGPGTNTNRQRPNEPPRTLGGSVVAGGAAGAGAGESGDPRERALRAAEERAKAAQGKGINSSNPKAGQLSAKLAAEKKKTTSPTQNDERMMDRGEWN